MILELDCGNSFVKWRVITATEGSLVIEGVAAGAADLIGDILNRDIGRITRCRLVSVRSDLETQSIVGAISESLKVDVATAHHVRQVIGVVNGYRDPLRLGLDRWLAIVAAYDMCRTACLVIDLGTAITVDLVADDGNHLGGYIAPGMALLRAQLLAHTRRIQYDAAEAALALADTSPGRTTAEGVERGCLKMARSYISSQIATARVHLGSDFVTYITGGDASLAADFPGVKYVPDMVFRGLAIACP